MADLDITKIPAIMRANNWANGAKLMEKWFHSHANNHPPSGIPSTSIIRLSWVLGYKRAKTVYDEMIKDKVWINAAAQKEIIKLLKRKQLLTGTKKRIGFPKMQLPHADKDSVQYRVVGGNWDMAFGDMDDLRAALANFVFKAIIVGQVEPILNDKKLPTGSYTVTIGEVGIYIKDSYDFNDAKGEDQELGNWDFDDNSVGRTSLFNGGETVHNSDFRKWRTANKMGGDFIVYSDIIYLKQTSGNTFTFKKQEMH